MNKPNRTFLPAIPLLSMLLAISGCFGPTGLSDKDIDRIAERLEKRLAPKLSAFVRQEMHLMKAESKGDNTGNKTPAARPLQKQVQLSNNEPPASDVIISIDGLPPVTKKEYEQIVEHRKTQWKKKNRKQILDNLLTVAVLADLARKHHLHEQKAFKSRLSLILADTIINILYQERADGLPPLDDKLLRSEYENRKALYRTPPYMNARTIEVETEEEALKLKDRLAAGEKFEELARKHSIAPSAANGGKMGRIYPGTVSSDLYSFLEKAKLSTVSGPFKLSNGKYALFKVTSRHSEAYRPFEMIKEQLRRTILDSRKKSIFSELEQEASKVLDTEFHPEKIKNAKDDDVLARVENNAITKATIDNTIRNLSKAQRRRFSTEAGRRQLLQMLFRRTLFYRYAQKDEDFRARHGAYLSYLQNEQLAQYLLQKEISPSIKVSDQEIADLYKRTKNKFKSRLPYFIARHILYTAPGMTKEAFAKAREKAVSALKRISEGEALSKLARNESKDLKTRKNGGKTDWFTKSGGIESTYFNAVSSLQAGQIATAPVRTSIGYYVLQQLDRSDTRPFQLLKKNLRNSLLADKTSRRVQELINEERKKRAIHMFPLRLEAKDDTGGRKPD